MTRLKVAEPAGDRRRKALAWGPEIRRLWGEGFSGPQIQEALAAAGVHVHRATVWREATRPDEVAPRRRAGAEAKGRASGGAAKVASSRPSDGPRTKGASPGGGAAGPERPASAAPPEVAVPARTGPSGLGSGKAVAQRFAESHIANPLIRRKAMGKQG